MFEVTCLGILVADVVGKPIDTYPERGRLNLVERMELHSGGCAANTGVSLAKIGVRTAVIGKVGNDGFGDFLVQVLQKHGIDTRGVKRDEKEATSATMVMVHSDGERSFLHYIGANAALRLEDVDMDIVRQSRVLHVAGALVMPGIDGEPTAELLRRAKEMGVITSFDTVWNTNSGWMQTVKPCLPYVDYMIPSIEEAKMLTGKEDPEDIARVFLDNGVKVVGLKMGERGCYIRTSDVKLAISRYQVQAVDALGAGDAFAAGFLTGVVKGWDLEQTGRFANAVGALCVTALGATTGVCSLEETLEFMQKTPMALG
ncbi:MAG: carbohydrate kinase family protein [Armatimonadota bacterium]